MPQWAGSCWYYLRFIDPDNSQRLLDAEAEKYWMPVDLYVGGAEHAVLHLLYARFWHKVLDSFALESNTVSVYPHEVPVNALGIQCIPIVHGEALCISILCLSSL